MHFQVVLYLFTYPPLSPFLNGLFTRLDAAFPLFGTAAFAIFCFYLIGAPALAVDKRMARISCLLRVCTASC